MNKSILIGCPVHNRSWILPTFIEKIMNIDYDKKCITLYFIVNNCTDDSHSILEKFKIENKSLYKDIIIEQFDSKIKFKDERTTETRMNFSYDWLSTLRNKLLDKCVKLDCDYLFSLDSDILVEPNVLKSLLSSGRHICSSLIYNGWLFYPEKPYAYPNILNIVNNEWKHIVNYKTKFPYKNEENNIIQVDMTGAISIISKDVCKFARYSKHPVGEDCAFSISAKSNGYDSYCNISRLSHHIMSEEYLEKYLNGDMYFWFDK